VYGAVNLNRMFDGFSVGLNLYGSRYSESRSDSLAGDLQIQTHARDLGKSKLKYILSARTEQTHTRSEIDDGAGGTSVLTDSGSTHGLDGRIYSAPVPLAKNLSFRGSAGVGYVWGDIRSTGPSTLGMAMLDWRLSKQTGLQLSYRYVDRPNITVSRLVRRPDTKDLITQFEQLDARRQTLSLNFRTGDGRKWRASLYAIQGLDYSATNVFADFDYRLNRDWRFGIRSTLADFANASYDDLELSLGRRFGQRELIAVWSKSQNKVMFELGSGAF
jgi:hypothetical protein